MYMSDTTEKLSIAQVCELLSVSKATVKNWIRLGKLTIEPECETFDKKYIESLIIEIKNGKDMRLKSRRNKNQVSGKILYKNYIKSNYNRKIVEDIINICGQITEDELRIILANFAIQLYKKSGGKIISENFLFDENNNITDNQVFDNLIRDLVKNFDISKVNMSNIQFALNCEIQSVPFEDTLGFIYISLCDLGHRKQKGAYYTHEKAVDILIKNLKNCLDIKNNTFCDPCCGTGNFLIGLIKNGAKISNLYGQDIDEINIFITRINMFLLNKSISKDKLYSQFVCGNTLFDTFSRKFSVILGNPPWGCEFSKKDKAYLSMNYITAKNKGIESYDLFIEKGLKMLKKNGYLAYILPEAILSINSHQQARELILKNTAFKFVNYMGNTFSGVQCPAVILIIQKSSCSKTKDCKIQLDNKEFIITKNRDIDATLFSLNMSDEEYDCLSAISCVSNAKYLLNNAKFALGIVTGNNRGYITDIKNVETEVILRGSDILRYAIKESNNYINFTPKKFQQVAPIEIYRAKEKLLYRFISEVPIFAYDNHQRLSLNSCNIIIPQIEGMNIKYVLAILNSSVATFFINKKYNSVKLLKSHIESLPIPTVSIEKQKDIIKKVDRIIYTSENILDLYEELDNEIMNIYSLSNKHINIIRTSLSGKNLFLH